MSRLRMVGAPGRNDQISPCIVIVVFLYLTPPRCARDSAKDSAVTARVKKRNKAVAPRCPYEWFDDSRRHPDGGRGAHRLSRTNAGGDVIRRRWNNLDSMKDSSNPVMIPYHDLMIATSSVRFRLI